MSRRYKNNDQGHTCDRAGVYRREVFRVWKGGISRMGGRYFAKNKYIFMPMVLPGNKEKKTLKNRESRLEENQMCDKPYMEVMHKWSKCFKLRVASAPTRNYM